MSNYLPVKPLIATGNNGLPGLDADIVFLIYITAGSRVCTEADIYVGGSRARFLLYIFHDENGR